MKQELLHVIYHIAWLILHWILLQRVLDPPNVFDQDIITSNHDFLLLLLCLRLRLAL